VVTPIEILNAVNAACSAETVRPLCDTVTVDSPTIVNFTFTGAIKIKADAVFTDVLANATTALQAFFITIQQTIARSEDIPGSTLYTAAIIATIMESDSNIINVTTSFTNMIPTTGQVLVNNGITITQA
jgi:phage-related baseplate assembly protein